MWGVFCFTLPPSPALRWGCPRRALPEGKKTMSEFITDFMLHPHLAYNWMVVAYFFLGGLSAGAYLFSVTANHWLKEFKPLARGPAILAPISLALGMFILWLDLGVLSRGIFMGIYFNPTSPLSWGSIFLGLFMLVSLANAFCCVKGGAECESRAQKLAFVGVPCALVVAMYTGILLNRAPGVVLWHNALLPVLFLNGGLISGIAAAILLSLGCRQNDLLVKLGRLVAGLVVLELAMTFAEVIILAGGGVEAVEASRALLTGQLSGLFWGAQILVGAVVPLVILIAGKTSGGLQAVASVLLLIGVYAMRHIIVIGGQLIG